jgi:hypothetical protein
VRIRPFEPEDVAGVAALWRYWFHDKVLATAPELEAWARRVYVERPGGDPDVPSLVAEDDDRRVIGFLGATTTPVLLDGAPATLAGVFPSVVAPDAPTTVATFLLRKFLAGPQALTVSDGGHVRFERIWEGLGGRVAPTASLRWIKVLRPASLGAGAVLGRRGWGRATAPAWRPVARGADALARRARPWWFGTLQVDEGGVRKAPRPPLALAAEPLTPETFVDALERVHARARLRPAYAPGYLAWLFDAMGRVPGQGTLEATLLRTADGAPVGWWVAYLRPGGTSRVFALDGADRHLDAVVDHLFARADDAGVGAVIGRLEPRLRRTMAARGTFTHNGGSRQFVHARDATLRDDALLGRLAFSRLEGENWYWWGIEEARVGGADEAGVRFSG